MPPDELLGEVGFDAFRCGGILRAEKTEGALADFVRFAFLSQTSPLYNEDHAHLRVARVGFLWTVSPYTKQGRGVAGEASLPAPHRALSGWQKARHEYLLRQLFGCDSRGLDFIITLYAPYCAEVDDATFCALLEHELYHCAHKHVLGVPQFNRKTGRPKYAILGHDSEEFVGVVRRYGVGRAAGDTARLVAAARRRPLISDANIARVCGSVAAVAA